MGILLILGMPVRRSKSRSLNDRRLLLPPRFLGLSASSGLSPQPSIKELTNFTPSAVEAVFASDVDKQKRADDDAKKKEESKQKAKPKKVSDGTVLKFIRKSTGYKNLETKEFATLVKGKDPEFFKMFDQLKDALATGDTNKVKAIARMKIKRKESPQE